MSLDKDTVARIARLARIEIAPEDLQPLAGELSGILGWIEQLNEVGTEDVAAMTSVTPMKLPLREDVVADGDRAEEILSNAPERQGHYFVVPKVVE